MELDALTGSFEFAYSNFPKEGKVTGSLGNPKWDLHINKFEASDSWMIKMKSTVEAVGKSNWAIFLKRSNYMKDVSGLTANTTQLLPYKKSLC